MHCKPYCSSSISCPIQIILMFYTSNHTCTIFLCSLRLPPPTNIKLRFERAKNRGLCVGLAVPEKRQRNRTVPQPGNRLPTITICFSFLSLFHKAIRVHVLSLRLLHRYPFGLDKLLNI